MPFCGHRALFGGGLLLSRQETSLDFRHAAGFAVLDKRQGDTDLKAPQGSSVLREHVGEVPPPVLGMCPRRGLGWGHQSRPQSLGTSIKPQSLMERGKEEEEEGRKESG